jgi:hypothetical protein
MCSRIPSAAKTKKQTSICPQAYEQTAQDHDTTHDNRVAFKSAATWIQKLENSGIKFLEVWYQIPRAGGRLLLAAWCLLLLAAARSKPPILNMNAFSLSGAGWSTG